MIITIKSGGWKLQAAPFIIVDDKKANIIRRNILPQIEIKLVQKTKKGNVLNIQEPEESNPTIKQWVKTIYHNYVYVLESTHSLWEPSQSQDCQSGGMCTKRGTPTMTNTQFEASHYMITERIIVTINQATTTETEEDTPLFR